MTLDEVLTYVSTIGTVVVGVTPTPIDDAILALVKIAATVNVRHVQLAGTPIDLTILHEYPEDPPDPPVPV